MTYESALWYNDTYLSYSGGGFMRIKTHPILEFEVKPTVTFTFNGTTFREEKATPFSPHFTRMESRSFQRAFTFQDSVGFSVQSAIAPRAIWSWMAKRIREHALPCLKKACVSRRRLEKVTSYEAHGSHHHWWRAVWVIRGSWASWKWSVCNRDWSQ